MSTTTLTLRELYCSGACHFLLGFLSQIKIFGDTFTNSKKKLGKYYILFTCFIIQVYTRSSNIVFLYICLTSTRDRVSYFVMPNKTPFDIRTLNFLCVFMHWSPFMLIFFLSLPWSIIVHWTWQYSSSLQHNNFIFFGYIYSKVRLLHYIHLLDRSSIFYIIFENMYTNL